MFLNAMVINANTVDKMMAKNFVAEMVAMKEPRV